MDFKKRTKWMRKSGCSLWKSFNDRTSGQDFSQGGLLLHILLMHWENGVLRKFTSWYHLKKISYLHVFLIFPIFSFGWIFSFETANYTFKFCSEFVLLPFTAGKCFWLNFKLRNITSTKYNFEKVLKKHKYN